MVYYRGVGGQLVVVVDHDFHVHLCFNRTYACECQSSDICIMSIGHFYASGTHPGALCAGRAFCSWDSCWQFL
jgi:hypothetical protein